MRLRVLASGSGGNSLVAESAGGARIMVDMGLACGTIVKRLAACGESAGNLDGVLFTHEHSDHCKGAARFHKLFPSVPFYANGLTAEAIAATCGVDGRAFREFGTGEPFAIADMRISPLATRHDTVDPVCFLIEDPCTSLFVGTDTGEITAPFAYGFEHAVCAILEANYEPELLWNSTRSEWLKQRIAGPTGHLANADAAELVKESPCERLRILLAGHRSRECNHPSLVEHHLRNAMAERGLHADFDLLEQDTPSPVWTF